MKRITALLLALLLPLYLCACRKQENISLIAFLSRWNRVSEHELSIEDFYFEPGEDLTQFKRFTVLPQNVLLRLVSTDQEILSQARLVLTKANADGSAAQITDAQVESFYTAACDLLCAFCDITEAKAKTIADALGLRALSMVEKEGEQTADLSPYHLTWLSTPLEVVFIIDNRWQSEVASTQKPPSRPAFDATTATRSETVPHE